MNCRDYALLVAEKIAGTLSAGKLAALEEHLAVCGRCRAELILQRKIIESLKKEVPTGLSPDFTRRVTRRALSIERAAEPGLRLLDLVPALVLAAAGVLLLVFRASLDQVIPPMAGSAAGALDTALASLGDAVVALFSHVPQASPDQLALLERFVRPLATSLAAAVAASVAVIWALSRTLTYLKS